MFSLVLGRKRTNQTERAQTVRVSLSGLSSGDLDG